MGRYKETNLLAGAGVNAAVAGFTSHKQRALQSLWSMLLGLVPSSSPVFGSLHDEAFVTRVRGQGGTPIFVERPHGLFHSWEEDPGYEQWFKRNKSKSTALLALSRKPACLALLDKLFEITKMQKLDPGTDTLKRLFAVKKLDTLASIAEAHGAPLLPNPRGLQISTEERELLSTVANETRRCWFVDSSEALAAQSYGQRAAAPIGHLLQRLLNGTAEVDSRFAVLSCHDKSLFALSCLLGFDLVKCGFAGHLVFELHSASDKQDTPGDQVIRMYYNPDPFGGAGWGVPVIPPLGALERVPPWTDLDTGDFSLAALVAHCSAVRASLPTKDVIRARL